MCSAALTCVAILASGATALTARTVEVQVAGMRVDAASGVPVVELAEKTGAAGVGGRQLPIWIGPAEAQAIALEMQGVPAPRPLTHDLMKQLVERLGGRLDSVVIEDLKDDTYYASVRLASPSGEIVSVDARPSDAIALALRLHGPILVAEDLFAKASKSGGPTAARVWGLTVQDVTPDLAAFFHVKPAHGVLVADVEALAPAHEVRRGDVITALDDARVGSVAELTSRAVGHPAKDPVRLSLERDGRPLTIAFAVE
ncbi:MAG TPA: bifunctional nuclease domain-containing protein [Candidatus Binatia bacterium]|jgi:hypothetical protein|nr:bifunctional nuclease domain-containing protein [Candidatus Binatia bacterium]